MAVSLAEKWQDNHQLFFAGRSESRAAEAAARFEAQSGSTHDAVHFAEVVVLATPHDKVFEAIEIAGGKENFAGKTVIDINNPVDVDNFTTTMTQHASLTEAIAEALPDSDLVKAFNMAQASVWSDSDMTYSGKTMTSLFTADSEQAIAVGEQLIKDVGAEPLHIGSNILAYQLEAAAAIVIKRLFTGSPPHSILDYIERV